jgi:hypothetical protein
MSSEAPRNSQALFTDYLNAIRGQFYADDFKKFSQQKVCLIQAIAYPVQYLDERGVWLPEKRVRQILNIVLREIKNFGATDKIRYFGGYFLDCVQKHMRHHDEAYYNEAKPFRQVTAGSMPLKDIIGGVEIREETPSQFAAEILAVAASLKRGPSRKKVEKTASQPTLF